jgi:hypothetical protein
MGEELAGQGVDKIGRKKTTYKALEARVLAEGFQGFCELVFKCLRVISELRVFVRSRGKESG